MNQPQAYALANQFQRASAKKILNTYKQFLKWKSGDEKILDIGSASGDVTTNILKPLLPGNISKLVGIDISKEMVEFARSQNKDPLVEFVPMDITIKNLPHNFVEQFDHIFSFYCLHFVEDERKAFENITKLLKPGGQTLLTLVANSSWFHSYENLSVDSKWKKYFENGKNYEPPYQKLDGQEHNIKQLLTDVGLSVHVCDTIRDDYNFPDLNYYRRLKTAAVYMCPVEFVPMDITIKKLPHNFVEQFDHIFSFYCLHFVEDERKAYENITRLLKPGGQTLLTFVANSSWFHSYENLSVDSKWKKYFENGKKYEPPYQKLDGQEHNIKHLLADVGLTVHVCETIRDDYSFPDLNYYRQFANAVLPIGLKIPDSMRQEFIEDQLQVVRNLKYTKLNSDNQETPWMYVKTLIIVASK